MQKIINVLAVASFALSSAIAASGVYVYPTTNNGTRYSKRRNSKYIN